MIDLSTRYLGLDLPHPIMPGASPLVDDLDMVRRLEDAGAAAIVMHSLFEEQIVGEQVATHAVMEQPAESFAEALSYFPDPVGFALGPEEYLEQIRRIRQMVAVPVIASLNGTTPGGWLEYARLCEEAGADALELNVYRLVTNTHESGQQADEHLLRLVREVRGTVRIPLAVKLSPFHSSLAWLARRLEEAGADGLVMFNRFYQPDVDPERLEVVRRLRLSDPSELLLRLRWLAILAGVVAIFAGITMVSNVPFYSFKEVNWKRRVPLWVILASVVGISVVSARPSLVLFALFLSYGLSGYAIWAFGRRVRPVLPEE